MIHVYIIPTPIWHKITTINPTIIFMVGEMDGPRTQITFTTTICNTKWITTCIIIWINPTQLWYHWGIYAINMGCLKPPIMPVCTQINFMGVEVGGPITNTTYIINRSAK